MKYTEFSQKIKEKYPYYSKVDDRELAEKIIEKYPYYKDKVTFDDDGNSVTVTDVIKNVFEPFTKSAGVLTDTSINIEETAEDSAKPATEAISGTIKNLNPIEQTKDIVNSATVKEYNNVEPTLRARTKEDDNSKVIYEPDSFDVLADKIAIASASDKGATSTKDLEDIRKKQNFAMMSAGIAPFVAGGQLSVGGLAILEGIQQAKNYVSSKIQGKDYDFMAYENLSSLLPDNTPSVVRVVSNLAELVADCVVAGRVENSIRKFLINEAVQRLETKMTSAGYSEEQVKTASNNLKKEIVKRETGIKEENGQVVKGELKPLNIDEAAKLNVDVRRLKVPKAEQPKETIKADVEVEPIIEPKQIKSVEEVNNDTWHGSGEDFVEFDLSMSRTGEGSNVHGWGTYLTPKRDVAEGYAKIAGKRTGKQFLYRVSSPSRELLLDEQKTLEEQPKIVKSAMLKILPKISNYNDFVAKLSSSGIDIKKTFDTEYKTEAYREYLKDPQKYNEEMYKKYTGKELYKLLIRQEMGAKNASLKLNELGVKGLTYEGSKDGINFVIFDKKSMKILDKIDSSAEKVNSKVSANASYGGPEIDVEIPKYDTVHDELVAKSKIIKDLAKEVDLPVRIGRTGRRNVLGLYYGQQEMVRLKIANDMLTLAHEIGHHEEKVLFGSTGRNYYDFTPEEKEFYKELKPLATKPRGRATRGKLFSEGLAQFISMFVNNPEQAQKVAPKFYKYFTENAPEKTPKIYNALVKAQERMSKYYSQDSVNQVKSHISFTEESPNLTVREKFDKIAEKFRTQLFDRLEPLRQAVKKAYKRAGKEISDTDINNPYFLARLYAGSVGRAEVFLNKYTYDFKTLQKNGKALGEIIREIHKNGGNLEDFATYLVAHDTLELAKRGIRSGVEVDSAKKTLDSLAPVYEKYAKDLYQYRLNLLKMLKDGQIITQEAYDNIKNASERYAPLQRVLDDDNINTVGNKNFKSKNPLKNIKGSGRDIINPLETIIEETYNVIKLVEKNRVGLAIADLADLDKSGAFVFGPIRKTKTVRDVEGNEFITSDYTIDENNEIKVLVNGKPKIYEVDKDIAKIMNGLTLYNQIIYCQALEKIATLPARLLKFGATDVNLAFAVKNILRDFPVAAISTENEFSAILENTIKLTVLGLKSLVNKKAREEWNNIADSMNKAGGGQSMLINDNRNSTIKAIDDLKYTGYLEKIWNKVKSKDFIEATKTGVIALTETTRAIVGFLEQVPRMAEFVSTLKGKPLTKANLEEAGFNARKITLDFASGGNFSKWLNKYVPYENAFFLGISKIAEVVKNPKMFKRLLGVVAGYMIITIASKAITEDDSEVNDVNRTQKYTNFVFKVGDTIYRIPKTIELAPFFTIIDESVNMLFDTIKGKKADKKEAIKNILGSFEANLTPNVLGQFVKMPIELYANKSMFFGTPIVSAELEKVLPEYQYTEYTTELAKLIAKTLGNIGINKGIIAQTIGSPQRLEYITNSLAGNTGRFLFERIDQLGRLAGVLPEKEYDLPEKTLADIPFIRAFVIRYPQQSRSIEDFYEKYNELKKYSNTFDLAKRRADTEAMQEMAIYKSVTAVDGIRKAMTEYRKVILAVYTDKQMSKDEKRQTIDSLMLTMLALAKQGLTMIKNIEEDIKTLS